MRSLLISAALFCMSGLVLAAQPKVDPVLVEPYTTADTDLGSLIDDPAARAVLDKYVPGLSKAPPMIWSSTLKSLQGYALDTLSDEVLARVDADLATLAPKPRSSASGVRTVNVNEAKVAPYTLPDPLTLLSGQRVADAPTWWSKRRPEILSMFESSIYGRSPDRPVEQSFDVFDRGTPAFDGKAVRKQVSIRWSKDVADPRIHLVEYLPAGAAGPVPMLLILGFTSPSKMFSDPGVREGMVWDPVTKQKKSAPSMPVMSRGELERLLEAGIGVAGYYYGDVDPDFKGGYEFGIRARYDGADEATRRPDAWGAIAAWAWSLSRVQDYFETDPAVNAQRVAINGASRLGKAALWAAAQDQRFAAVIACCSGKLGAGLLRRNFGETIATAGAGADYWLAPNALTYVNREESLPVDGHMLLALIAPRAVLLQTGKYDHAADPKGEFLAAVAAGPVYNLLGKQDLGTTIWPPTQPILNDLGYYMHSRGHGMAPGDWEIYRTFLREHLLR